VEPVALRREQREGLLEPQPHPVDRVPERAELVVEARADDGVEVALLDLRRGGGDPPQPRRDERRHAQARERADHGRPERGLRDLLLRDAEAGGEFGPRRVREQHAAVGDLHRQRHDRGALVGRHLDVRVSAQCPIDRLAAERDGAVVGAPHAVRR
jgi:hypothetical protein